VCVSDVAYLVLNLILLWRMGVRWVRCVGSEQKN